MMWKVTDATGSSGLLKELPGDRHLIVNLDVSGWIVHGAIANFS